MQNLLSLAPLVVFFATYQLAGIYAATAALMVAMTLVVAVDWLRTRHVPAVHAASLALVLVFGGLTLWLRDAQFIQWKPTILFGLLGCAHIVSEFVGQRVLTQRLMSELVPEFRAIEAPSWRLANRASALYYIALGGANWWVAHNLSEAAWVRFKTIGLTVLLMVFVMALGLWLMKRPELRDQPAAS